MSDQRGGDVDRRDEFDTSSEGLTGKTAPVGGTWSGGGAPDDFTVEPGKAAIDWQQVHGFNVVVDERVKGIVAVSAAQQDDGTVRLDVAQIVNVGEVDAEDELRMPPSTAPLEKPLIRRTLPVFIGGPLHGEPVPDDIGGRRGWGALEPDDRDSLGTREVVYVREKARFGGSRRILEAWVDSRLTPDERAALIWRVVLERAGLL